jgi:hypothetical protein
MVSPTPTDSLHTKTEPIYNLGRTIFFAAVCLWIVSGFVRVGPIMVFVFVFALVFPRLLFRRRRARIEIRWGFADTVWLVGAVAIYLSQILGITPPTLLRAIGIFHP